MTITHDALDLTVQPFPKAWLHSPSRHGTWGSPEPFQTWNVGTPLVLPPLLVTSGGYHCRPVQICSLDLTIQGPHSYWLLVATKAHTVSKRAECILLECFLVYQCCLLFPILSHCFSLFLQSCSNLYKCKKINCAQEPFGLLLASQTVGLKVELSGINSAVEKVTVFRKLIVHFVDYSLLLKWSVSPLFSMINNQSCKNGFR